MVKIFISYRRDDTKKDAGRIYDRLVTEFGKENVFKDVDSIPIGKDFREVLTGWVSRCNVMLVLIGSQWLTLTDGNGKPRIHNPSDFVSYEVNLGLHSPAVTVIPVIIAPAITPSSDQLPAQLHDLAFLNAAFVRDDPDFHRDIDRLVETLKTVADQTQPPIQVSGWAKLVNSQHKVIIALVSVLVLFIAALISIYGMILSQQAQYTMATATADNNVFSKAERGILTNATWHPYFQEFDGVSMVLVPAGCFMMGSTDEQFNHAIELGGAREEFIDEQPTNEVCFDKPFWIDRYEVSNAQFRQFNGIAAQISN